MFRLPVCVALICAASVPILNAQTPDQTIWKLKGAQLRVSSDKITYEAKKYALLSVPTKAVTSVCYDTAIHARGPSAWQATEAMGGTRGGIILAPIVLPVVGGVHASKVTRHFIVFYWTSPQPVEDLPMPTLTVEAEKGNYAAVLEELQQRTGKPWTDVGQHRRDVYTRFGNELKAAEKEKHAPHLDIKEKSRIGNSVVDSYSYRAVLRTGSSGEGDLFLFQGEKKQKRLVAIVHGSIKNEAHKTPDAVAMYGSAPDSLPTVTEVRLPNHTLIVGSLQGYEYNPECPTLP